MKREWTRAEVVLWFFALIVFIVAGILVFTKVLGTWALFVGTLTVFAVLSLRYRAEIKRGESRR